MGYSTLVRIIIAFIHILALVGPQEMYFKKSILAPSIVFKIMTFEIKVTLLLFT